MRWYRLTVTKADGSKVEGVYDEHGAALRIRYAKDHMEYKSHEQVLVTEAEAKAWLTRRTT